MLAAVKPVPLLVRTLPPPPTLLSSTPLLWPLVSVVSAVVVAVSEPISPAPLLLTVLVVA